MKDFSASLIREKIIFKYDPADTAENKADDAETDLVIRSNRIALPLESEAGTEWVVVRGQTAAITLALAHKVMYSFHRTGLFLPRQTPYDWKNIWESVLSAYETTYNPDIWACIYIKGQPVFRTLTVPYLDIIEKIAMLNPDNYDTAISKAEAAMRKLGMQITISSELHVSGIFNDNRQDRNLRCGIIQRLKTRNNTFNFIISGSESHRRIEQSLMTASYFLEAASLKRVIHELQGRMRAGEVLQVSTDGRKLRQSAARINVLYKLISAFEEHFDVRYRPEKPDILVSDV